MHAYGPLLFFAAASVAAASNAQAQALTPSTNGSSTGASDGTTAPLLTPPALQTPGVTTGTTPAPAPVVPAVTPQEPTTPQGPATPPPAPVTPPAPAIPAPVVPAPTPQKGQKGTSPPTTTTPTPPGQAPARPANATRPATQADSQHGAQPKSLQEAMARLIQSISAANAAAVSPQNPSAPAKSNATVSAMKKRRAGARGATSRGKLSRRELSAVAEELLRAHADINALSSTPAISVVDPTVSGSGHPVQMSATNQTNGAGHTAVTSGPIITGLPMLAKQELERQAGVNASKTTSSPGWQPEQPTTSQTTTSPLMPVVLGSQMLMSEKGRNGTSVHKAARGSKTSGSTVVRLTLTSLGFVFAVIALL